MNLHVPQVEWSQTCSDSRSATKKKKHKWTSANVSGFSIFIRTWLDDPWFCFNLVLFDFTQNGTASNTTQNLSKFWSLFLRITYYLFVAIPSIHHNGCLNRCIHSGRPNRVIPQQVPFSVSRQPPHHPLAPQAIHPLTARQQNRRRFLHCQSACVNTRILFRSVLWSLVFSVQQCCS